MPLVVTSDNGYIFLRNSDGTWQQVFSLGDPGTPGSCPLLSFSPAPAFPPSVLGWTWAGQQTVSSADAGQSWSAVPSPDTPWSGVISRDETGRLYVWNPGSLWRSSNRGAVWELLPSDSASDVQGQWVGDGYIWGIQLLGQSGPMSLYRTDYEGGHLVAFDGLLQGDPYSALSGGVGTSRLYVVPSYTTIISLDITDPDNPVPSTAAPPWDSNVWGIISVRPVTNQVALAQVYDPGDHLSALWRTADAGQTWTQVVPPTPTPSNPQANIYQAYLATAVDPANASTLYAALSPPQVLTSTDQGLTWTAETVDAPGADSVFVWLSVAVSGAASVQARAVQSLMDRIDADLAAAGLPDYPWTDPVISSADQVKAVQFVDMRTAIGVLYARKGLTLPDWTDGAPGGPSVGTAPTHMQTTHYTDLLDWLGTYEGTPVLFPPLGAGVNAKAYDPTLTPPVSINPTWVSNVQQVMPPGQPGIVRCEFLSANSTAGPVDSDYSGFNNAIGLYLNPAGPPAMGVFIILGYGMFDPAGMNDTDLDAKLSNPAIKAFASTFQTALTQINAGPNPLNVILWNEPNNNPPDTPNPNFLNPPNFAGLLYNCGNAIPSGMNVNLYWGGIFTNPNSGVVPDQGALDYIQSVYEALEGPPPLAGPDSWPWSGINIHIHLWRPQEQIENLFSQLAAIRQNGTRNDTTPIIIGEWGDSNNAANFAVNNGNLYSAIVAQGPQAMLFFTHQEVIDSGGSDYGLITAVPPSGGYYQLGTQMPLWLPYVGGFHQ